MALIEIHFGNSKKVQQSLNYIFSKLNKILRKMASFKEEVLAQVETLKSALSNIEGDINRQAATNQELLDKINAGGLDAVSQEEIRTALQSGVDLATRIAAIVPEPIEDNPGTGEGDPTDPTEGEG